MSRPDRPGPAHRAPVHLHRAAAQPGRALRCRPGLEQRAADPRGADHHLPQDVREAATSPGGRRMSALSTPGSATPVAYRGQGRGGARLADLVWLTWRQHRPVILVGLAVAGVVTGSMLYVAARIATINHQCGNAACPPDSAQAAPLTGLFGLTNLSLYLIIIVMFLPLLAGVFLGAPLLAREHEQRTLLLAWSQDITPQRWLWTKFALLGALTAAAAAAVSAAAGHLAHMVSPALSAGEPD